MTTTPKPGDRVAHQQPALPGLPGNRIVAEVLDVETIPPHRTVTPDVPRWAMTVRIIEGDRHSCPGKTEYWPGMSPGDFEFAA